MRSLAPITILLSLLGLSACGDAPEQPSLLTIAGGDPHEGRALIRSYGCGTCHTIEGLRDARGKVGPRLEEYAQQHLLAGFLPNTPRYLIPWLMDPVALKPQTGMPAQGVTEVEARHMAAYLYSLGREELRVYPPEPQLPLRDDAVGGSPLEIAAPPAPSETEPRTRRILPPFAEGTAPRS